MEVDPRSDEDAVLAGVAELRERFPRTLDLYREVCVLLFFRHGITPTANKLYQLVRKGSMSAPAEALNRFWETLRERSRVSVEHADLPDELKAAAGDMVATIWEASQAMAQESVAQVRFDAATAAEAARNAEVEAMAAVDAASRELEQTRARLLDADDQIGTLRQELAASAATNAGCLARIEDARNLLAQNHEMVVRERAEHATERERLEERTRLAEQRFIDMEKRALLDMDRERTASLKLQKALEHERAAHVKLLEQLRAEYATVQREVAKLREQLGALQHATTSLRDERDRAYGELSAARSGLEAAIRQAATDATRAEHLEEELQRLRIRAKQENKTPTGPTRKSETIRRRRHKNKADVG